MATATAIHGKNGAELIRIKANLIEQAQASHAQWPQYADHWTTPEWLLVRFNRRVTTKAGVAFERGDYTIARGAGPEDPCDHQFCRNQNHAPYWTAFSVRNNIDTQIPVTYFEAFDL